MTIETALPKTRDADNTRQLLLAAARRRFANDGYAATTVREIATDAGVNVALINRYFTSKEGLFQACLKRVAEDLQRPEDASMSLDRILNRMVDQIVDSSGDQQLQLLLLLRTSGDERADQLRRGTLESFAAGIGRASGGAPAGMTEKEFALRAQIALATGLGILLLRSSTAMEPLTSATHSELRGPVADALFGLLGPKL